MFWNGLDLELLKFFWNRKMIFIFFLHLIFWISVTQPRRLVRCHKREVSYFKVILFRSRALGYANEMFTISIWNRSEAEPMSWTALNRSLNIRHPSRVKDTRFEVSVLSNSRKKTKDFEWKILDMTKNFSIESINSEFANLQRINQAGINDLMKKKK